MCVMLSRRLAILIEPSLYEVKSIKSAREKEEKYGSNSKLYQVGSKILKILHRKKGRQIDAKFTKPKKPDKRVVIS